MADDSFASLIPLIAQTTEELGSGNSQAASKAAKELKIKMDECHARVNSIDGSNLTKDDQLRLLEELARIREQKFERQRLKNIEENNRLLEELGLGEASKEVFGKRGRDSEDNAGTKKPPAKKRVKKETDASADPPRRSSRRVPTTEQDRKENREQLERELEQEAQRKEDKRRREHETRLRDMSLLELLKRDPVEYIHSRDSGEDGGGRDKAATVKKEAVDKEDDVSDEQAQDEEDEDEEDESNEQNDEDAAASLSSFLASREAVARPSHALAKAQAPTPATDNFRRRAQEMRFRAIHKVTAQRIHSMQYHADKETELIFAGDKYGQLGILRWNRESASETAQTWRMQPHINGCAISCIRFDVTDSRKAFTGSYDCTARRLDFETGISAQVFRCNDGYEHESLRLITHLDTPSQTPSLLHIADNGGGLSLKDVRESDNTRGVRYVLSKNKLGSVSINPANQHEVCVASNDHAVRIFDLRMTKQYADTLKPVVEDANDLPFYDCRQDTKKAGLLAEQPHKKAVTSAYYSPDGSHILSTSFDNTVKLFDSSLNPIHSVRHNNETGRWLSVFRMQWINPAPGSDIPLSFITPSMKRSLEVWSMDDPSTPCAEIADGDNVTAVPAVVCAKPDTQLADLSIAGGNGSGKVVLYM
ncbi:hypothetical protein E3P99_01015 [Wallemia hederae]|uniref:DNA damage-binding protein CMR1 n=1 Tax=Wallemia hederae TaxID=1540922 RepID=A0A4T0FSD1_9BASI|nr:hypothetical protein E3P99_01015 [Wallemia hederae]